MNAVGIHLEPVFLWLLRATAQASVLVGLVLLLQWALGRRLGIRGRCFLWLILLTLLVLPWIPRSTIDVTTPSLQSLARGSVSSLRRWSNRSEATSTLTSGAFDPEALRARRAEETMGGQRLPWPAARGLDAPAIRVLAFVWLGGTIAFAGYIMSVHRRLRRVLSRASLVTDRKILSLLDDCKRLLGVSADVDVLSTDAIGGPALCGYRRPRLLLSDRLLAEPDPDELRHIFLHELAHLRRRDILVGYVASLVHMLQWFNPFVTLAFRRMQADRELACDALALSVLDPDETCAYGRTVVRQLERLGARRRPPILAAITGDKSRIKQRIALIAGFDKARYGRSPLTVLLALCLVCLGLVLWLAGDRALGGAVESAVVTWEVRARRNVPTTHQDKHANIHRACIRNILTGKFLVVDGEKVVCNADQPGDAGLWEVRFDVVSNTAESDVYLYSVAARKYLTSDEEGNLAVEAEMPSEAARWGTYSRPQGVWLISHHFKEGYLHPNDDGRVKAVSGERDAASYWDVHAVWRIKTSDDPAANPDWQREKVPGPD